MEAQSSFSTEIFTRLYSCAVGQLSSRSNEKMGIKLKAQGRPDKSGGGTDRTQECVRLQFLPLTQTLKFRRRGLKTYAILWTRFCLSAIRVTPYITRDVEI